MIAISDVKNIRAAFDLDIFGDYYQQAQYRIDLNELWSSAGDIAARCGTARDSAGRRRIAQYLNDRCEIYVTILQSNKLSTHPAVHFNIVQTNISICGSRTFSNTHIRKYLTFCHINFSFIASMLHFTRGKAHCQHQAELKNINVPLDLSSV